MAVPKRKFISEFGLNMRLVYGVIVQQGDFEHLERMDGLPDFHLYMIARRPRIGLVPESVVFTGGRVKGQFTIQLKGTLEHLPFDVENHLGTDKLTVVCPYPHSAFRFEDPTGQVVMEGRVAHLMNRISNEFLNKLDLEIVYVGQSFGEEGERTSLQRLASHSTLQKIYAEAMQRSPDQEIWIVLPHFEEIVLASFDGRSKDYLTSDEEDSNHISQIVSEPVSEQQRINFTEAALIRYFEPEYNVMFKGTFPNPAHTTYSECYDIDLNAVSIEMDTEGLRHRLWSQKIPRTWLHLHNFPLHSAADRKSMFDF
jgi:hypothetical protein